MSNLYEWEAQTASELRSRGDAWLTWALIGAALVIFLIAIFSRNILFKSLVLAYVILP